MAKTTTPELPAGPDAAKVATISAACLGAVFALGALGVFNGRVALSVAAGAVIAVANLASLNAIIRAMLQPAVDEAAEEALAREEALAKEAGTPEDPAAEAETPETPPDHAAEGKRGGAAWGLFALLKMVLLFGGIWLLLTRGLVDPIPLVVGYGVLPLAIAVSGVVTSLAPRPRGRRARTRTE
ncbi:MAG TPA: hypothetical protein VLT33_38660 [Labilithrix sp.]|nr:hypothetical protein [Labilithrix sp.]